MTVPKTDELTSEFQDTGAFLYEATDVTEPSTKRRVAARRSAKQLVECVCGIRMCKSTAWHLETLASYRYELPNGQD